MSNKFIERYRQRMGGVPFDRRDARIADLECEVDRLRRRVRDLECEMAGLRRIPSVIVRPGPQPWDSWPHWPPIVCR